ncbi:MOSC domain-containing protein YiiM [Reichenbachiella faecimaris]|uniref:MOSC domain-containing protein YiiM n=1 Tax=Reichenbachiella faecimaris TaxID=692418 RepID=A0A1W2G8G5_REIFA|nr:MOSC domain-containing protein [Reichenbachiella faecimaris]SMD32618.1 MOSC domain-containing protein YiiM [Reichenbachiella faecimaris]
MSYDEPVMKQLLRSIPQEGKVEWIGIRKERKALPIAVEQVEAKEKTGLEGDHFKGSLSGKRQVTLIQQEHLEVVAKILGKASIDPWLTRRNIVVSGINLLSLKSQKFKIGNAILETSGICAPCNRMEENLGPGGYNAMRGHGGITARVINGGGIKIGDAISLV